MNRVGTRACLGQQPWDAAMDSPRPKLAFCHWLPWIGDVDVPPTFRHFWSGLWSEIPESLVGHGSTQLSGPFSGRSSFISSGSEDWTVVIHEFMHSPRQGKNQVFRYALVSAQCPGFSYYRLISSPHTVQYQKGQGFPGLSGTLFGGSFRFRRGLLWMRKSLEWGTTSIYCVY